MHACMHECMHVCMYVCMCVCMYACMHACMYVCMYVCMFVFVFVFVFVWDSGNAFIRFSLPCSPIWQSLSPIRRDLMRFMISVGGETQHQQGKCMTTAQHGKTWHFMAARCIRTGREFRKKVGTRLHCWNSLTSKSPFPICSIKLLKLLKFHWTFRFWLTFVIFDWFWLVLWGFWSIWACRKRWEVWFWQIFIRFRCPWRHFLRILAEVPWRFPESPWKSLITHYFLFFS